MLRILMAQLIKSFDPHKVKDILIKFKHLKCSAHINFKAISRLVKTGLLPFTCGVRSVVNDYFCHLEMQLIFLNSGFIAGSLRVSLVIDLAVLTNLGPGVSVLL